GSVWQKTLPHVADPDNCAPSLLTATDVRVVDAQHMHPARAVAVRDTTEALDEEKEIARFAEALAEDIAPEDALLIEVPEDTVGEGSYSAFDNGLTVPNPRQFRPRPTSHRCEKPWGYVEPLSSGENFEVNRIVVNPYAKVVLRNDARRAKHWVVVEGSANVIVGREVNTIAQTQSIYIPQNELHCLENPAQVPLHLIEVQSDTYLGEENVIQFGAPSSFKKKETKVGMTDLPKQMPCDNQFDHSSAAATV
ncbi:MAG: hypothetical protein OXD48_11625, partial [Litoreibacter sp.]|nr:hypothetical protein [Litoreibacter sp.]